MKYHEQELQIECVKWLKEVWLVNQDLSKEEQSHARKLMFHVKNESSHKSTSQAGSRNMRMGMVGGVSDFVITFPTLVDDCPESILFIEFKDKGKALSTNQLLFRASAKFYGRKYYKFDDAQKFKDFFTNHVKLNNYESRR